MRYELGLYYTFICKFIKSKLEYKFAICMETIANMINIGSYYVFLTVLFQQVSSIGSWSYYEAIFLVSINWMATSICGFFFWKPMLSMGDMVKSGEFDSMLIRPINPLRYCIYRQFQYTFIGRLAISIFFLCYSLLHLQILWNVGKVFFLIITIISGTMIHAGIYIIMGATAFWLTDNNDVMNLVASYDGIRTFIDFPLSAFGKSIQIAFTFVIPYAFVNYYPSVYLLNKESSQMLFTPVFQFASFFVAIFIFTIGVKVWYKGVKKYGSSGT